MKGECLLVGYALRGNVGRPVGVGTLFLAGARDAGDGKWNDR